MVSSVVRRVRSSGRTSSKEPNGQNMPPDVRACFEAAEGCTLIVADAKNQEGRLAAALSGDAALLARIADSFREHTSPFHRARKAEVVRLREELAALDAPASGRMAVAEAITNLLAAPIELERIKLICNWMAACGEPGEDAALFDTRTQRVWLGLAALARGRDYMASAVMEVPAE